MSSPNENVIDFHLHIGILEHWHPYVINYFKNINPPLFQNFHQLMNPTALEQFLEKEGVTYAVVLAEDSPKVTGIVPNQYVHDFCLGQKKFIPFASINPTTASKPEQILHHCITTMKFKGLKLYPSYQHFYPNQPSLYPLYEKAVELNIPIMFHTGSSIYQHSKIKYADPLHLDDVATDFPDLTIIMAHSGRGFWYDKAFFLSRIHKNMYMEISGLPPQNLLQYFPDLEKNANKIIFGSDWPGIKSIKNNIISFKSIPLKKSTQKKILFHNAQNILGL